MAKPRARELGLAVPGRPGPNNAITDVPGVRVGYRTLDGVAANGKPIKTGVTAILPVAWSPSRSRCGPASTPSTATAR